MTLPTRLVAILPYCLIASFAALSVVVGATQVPRDTNIGAVAGTGSIAGVVVTDDTVTRPIRKALVTVTAGGRGAAAIVVVTDDSGRFVFNALAGGRYQVTASKPGYLNASYGAARPGRPGTPVQLIEGQQL